MSEKKCGECGCTHWTPCIDEVENTCSWAEPDLCSACADPGDAEWRQICPDCRGTGDHELPAIEMDPGEAEMVPCARCKGLGEIEKVKATAP